MYFVGFVVGFVILVRRCFSLCCQIKNKSYLHVVRVHLIVIPTRKPELIRRYPRNYFQLMDIF